MKVVLEKRLGAWVVLQRLGEIEIAAGVTSVSEERTRRVEAAGELTFDGLRTGKSWGVIVGSRH